MEKKRILIVEDESITALGLSMQLVDWDYEVISIVSRGEDAIKVGISKNPDLIIMDIFLDDNIDGIAAVHEIHKKINIPVIYLTASEDEKTFDRAKETDYFEYIVKPYSPIVLSKVLDKCFSLH